MKEMYISIVPSDEIGKATISVRVTSKPPECSFEARCTGSAEALEKNPVEVISEVLKDVFAQFKKP